MKKEIKITKAGKQYTAAHAAHYKTKNLLEALDLYRGVMTDHPDTHEAEYSRSQIQNIAKSVISKQALLDAEVDLVLAHFKNEEALLVGPSPAMPIP